VGTCSGSNRSAKKVLELRPWFFGAILFIVDLREDLPLYWCLTEGPINTAFGIIILALSRRTGDG